MSKSLTINANPFTKQTNSLRGVPSGSTTPIDENVKWTPQTLTEEQKAQARENIGAAETGGTTLYEFHYKRDASTEPVVYYIDADGYEPKEGDLISLIFDWPMYPEHNPAVLKNNIDDPNINILNAPVNQYNDYDEIDGSPDTRWTLKLEKVENVWTAYNISTIEQVDWNCVDENSPSFIKNKPEIPTSQPDFSSMSKIVFNMSSAGTAGMTNTSFFENQYSESRIWRGNVYLDNIKVTSWQDINTYTLAKGKHKIYYDNDYFPAVRDWNKMLYEEAGITTQSIRAVCDNNYSGTLIIDSNYPYGYSDNAYLCKNVVLKNHVPLDKTIAADNLYIDFTNSFTSAACKDNNQDRSGTTLYVPKGMGSIWKRLNKFVKFVYEYDTLSYPKTNTYCCLNSSNYSNYQPQVTGLQLVELDTQKYMTPFFIENISNTTENATLSQVGSPNAVTVEYSTDAETWSEWGTTSATPLTMSLNPGDKFYLRASGITLASSTGNYHNLTGVSKIGGNVLSLRNNGVIDLSSPKEPSAWFIYKLFYNNSTLINAEDLIISYPTSDFTHLESLFEDCVNMVKGPKSFEIDRAKVENLFKNCGSMTDMPEILTTHSGSYTGRRNMFEGCSSITRTCKLYLSSSSGDGFANMFKGCSSLNYIDASGITNFKSNTFNNWVNGVAATGTFIAAVGSKWATGVSGIPSGWDVIYK